MHLSTLRNKDSSEWNISIDSAFLGLTDTHRNTLFAPSVQIFLTKLLFQDHFKRKMNKFCNFCPECSFHGTQIDWHNLTVTAQTMQPDPRYKQNWVFTL